MKPWIFPSQGLWSRFFPVYDELRKELEEKTVGKVNFVSVNFGANLKWLDRLQKKSLGGGCVLDLGVYAIQLALLAYGHEEPEKILVNGFLNDEGEEFINST